jgi:hypothetical protein
MKFLAACTLAALAHTTLALPKYVIICACPDSANSSIRITRTGRYLYNPDGSRFYIKVRTHVASPRQSLTRLCRASRTRSRARSLSRTTPMHSLSQTTMLIRWPCQPPASETFLIFSRYVILLASNARALPNSYIHEQLTVNAVRVYSVNSSLNHDECMSALDTAGIYTMSVS